MIFLEAVWAATDIVRMGVLVCSISQFYMQVYVWVFLQGSFYVQIYKCVDDWLEGFNSSSEPWLDENAIQKLMFVLLMLLVLLYLQEFCDGELFRKDWNGNRRTFPPAWTRTSQAMTV